MSNVTIQGELETILKSMKRQQLNSGPASAQLRKDRLQRSLKLIRENHKALAKAMSEDFGHRSLYQSNVADMVTTSKMLQHAIDHLDSWMQAEKPAHPILKCTPKFSSNH
jgi:coniferyl-aldehyde dehydrogenase